MFETGKTYKTKDTHQAVIVHHCKGAIECLIGYLILDDGSEVPCTWSPRGEHTSRYIYEGKRSTNFDLLGGIEK